MTNIAIEFILSMLNLFHLGYNFTKENGKYVALVVGKEDFVNRLKKNYLRKGN